MARSDVAQHIPTEIVSMIFSKLEVDQLARCKTLNKDWYKTISSKFFLQEHVENMKARSKYATIFQLEYCYAALFYDHELVDVTPNGRIVYEEERDVEFLSCCNGVVAKCDKFDNFYLCNPITFKTALVPQIKMDFPAVSNWAQVFFGLSYECEVDDFKLVRIALFDTPGVHPTVNVYSRNAGVWIRAPDFPEEFPIAQPGVSVAGKLHWRIAIFNKQYFITAFNVKDNSYSRIAMPEVPVVFGIQDLVALDDQTLGVSCNSLIHGAPYTLWILKDYNDHLSWFKVVIDLDNAGIFFNHAICLQPMHFKKPGRNVVKFRFDLHGYYAVYDIKEQTFMLVEDEVEDEGYATLFQYVPSLQSPLIEATPSWMLNDEGSKDVNA